MRGSKAKAIRRRAKALLDIDPGHRVYGHTNIQTKRTRLTAVSPMIEYGTSTVVMSNDSGRKIYQRLKAICKKGRTV